MKNSGKQQKYVLLDFTAVWCGGCKAYDKYVFQDSLIANEINERFILLKIDRDDPKNTFLVDKFEIRGLPHIVLIDPEERILGSIETFEKKFVEQPYLFISQLDGIIAEQKAIGRLESLFHTDTSNVEVVHELLQVYRNVGRYLGVRKMKNLLIDLDPTPEILLEHKFNDAIRSLKNELNAEPLISLVNEDSSLTEDQTRTANSQLLYHYRKIDDVQSQDHYYSKLIESDPDYFKKEYARFLFEHNFKIETAISLSAEYLSNRNAIKGHWGQFLKAHMLASSGELNQSVREYGDWMEKNKQIWIDEKEFWAFYFYARFASFYNADLERALSYIKIIEGKRSLLNDKLLMAEILYKLGQIENSRKKLKESLAYTEDRYEYDKLIDLIETYNK